MPSRAPRRATAEGTAYFSGTPASSQKHSRAPRRRISQPRSRRQTTLTQYERGTPLTAPTIEGSEEEFDEPRPKKRSRRSTLPGKTESQNTLTQIGWVSTIPPSDSDEDEEDSEASGGEELDDNAPPDAGEDGGAAGPVSDEEFNGFSDGEEIGAGDAEDDGYKSRQKESGLSEETSMHETSGERAHPKSRASSEQHQSRPEMGQQLPHTPRKIRFLEVPSSQSPPVTPLSAIHTHERRRLLRSPLRSLSTNPQSLLDSPSRIRKSTPGSIRRSIRKAVAFKDQSSSSAHKRRPHSPVSSGVADSEDEYNDEEEDDENEDVVDAVAGIDIGQETQAYIRRIDFHCASARATAEPDPSEVSTQDEDHSPPPHSSANRSFNFDEAAHQHPQTQPEQPVPLSSQAVLPPSHQSSPTSPQTPTIKQEPETQQQHQPRNVTQDRRQPHLSSPVQPSPASSTTATITPTQISPRPTIKPDPAEAPSSPPPQSSYLPETYRSHVSADDHIPPSQPTQLHLKQILLQPSTQAQSQTQTQTQEEDVGEDQDQDERDRVPDSQGEERHEEGDQKENIGARAARRGVMEVLVTATQVMQQGSVGEEFSLPPPPPWSQTQTQSQSQTQETVDEE